MVELNLQLENCFKQFIDIEKIMLTTLNDFFIKKV